MAERLKAGETVNYTKVAVAAILGLAGIDLFLKSKYIAGALGLAASAWFWKNRHN